MQPPPTISEHIPEFYGAKAEREKDPKHIFHWPKDEKDQSERHVPYLPGTVPKKKKNASHIFHLALTAQTLSSPFGRWRGWRSDDEVHTLGEAGSGDE